MGKSDSTREFSMGLYIEQLVCSLVAANLCLERCGYSLPHHLENWARTYLISTRLSSTWKWFSACRFLRARHGSLSPSAMW
jgi:hypothetical protein